MSTASACPMNPATVDDLSMRSNSVSSGSWLTVQGVVWGGLSVAILSGWFVVTRLGLRHDLRVWDVIVLRFGEGAVLLTPVLLVGPLRLRFQARSQGISLAVLWGAPFILLVGLGLQATSATLTSAVTPALMPVFAGFIAWTSLAERPRRRQLCGYGLIVAGLLALVYGYVGAEGHVDIGGVAALVTAAVMWGALCIAAAPNRPYVASSRGADLLLVRHLLSAALPRARPFEPDACVRPGVALSIRISGRHDERGRALRFQSRCCLARTASRGRHHCTYAGHGDSFGDTGSRRMAIMADGSRYLRHRAGGRIGRCLRQSG